MQDVIPFQKKHSQYFRTVRDINLEQPVTFRVQIIRVRCPSCKKPFPLPPPITISSHARTTNRSRDLALTLIVKVNGSLQSSGEVTRDITHLNLPRTTLHDWKQSAAGNVSHREIIKQLQFSGVLCVDECRPLCSDTFNLFATDRLKGRILYLEETEDRYAISGNTAERFFLDLKALSIHPKAIIADMSGGIHAGAQRIFPHAHYQYDYFHVIQSVHEKLKKEIRSFWWQLRKQRRTKEAALLWEAQWTLLRNQESWDAEDEQRWKAVYTLFPNTIIARLPAFKQELRDIFDQSKSIEEAKKKRDEWIAHWRSSLVGTRYLNQIVKLMQSPFFLLMVTYLDQRWIPRTTNAETLIRNYRKMEKTRYGFGSIGGRRNHLKLFQLKTYLAQKVG